MQWRVLVGILFALVVAVFAVVNVRAEPINYVFGIAYVPLVLIIMGSALLGALAIVVLGAMGRMKLSRENRRLRRENADLQETYRQPHVPVELSPYETASTSDASEQERKPTQQHEQKKSKT